MSTKTLSLLVWALAFGAILSWEGFVLARRHDGWLPFSEVLAAIRMPVVRWVAFAIWLWFGWHVFVRTWQLFGGD